MRFILLLLIVWPATTLCNGGLEQDETFLQSFSVISSLSFGKNQHETTRVTVEEVYDGTRGLGKVIVQDQTGSRTRLYVNSFNRFILEAKYTSTDELVECNIFRSPEDQRARDSYLSLFKTFSDLQQSTPVGDAKEFDHIIGPSAPIYLYRYLLRSKWQDRQSELSQDTSQNVDQYRMFVSDKEIKIDSQTSAGKTRWVKFRQSDFLLDRAPLLSKLAASMSLIEPESGMHFQLDIVSISELEIGRVSQIRADDLFKLPTWFRCNKPNPDTIFPFQQLDPYWIGRALGGSSLSARISSSALSWSVAVEVDLATEMMRLEANGSSWNVIDMHRKLLYYMPNEPSGFELNDYKLDKARNGACIILNSETLNGITNFWSDHKQSERENLTLTSRTAWKFLVGNTNSVMYLGRTKNVAEGRFADLQSLNVHEFEIRYNTFSELPALLLLFMPAVSSLQAKYMDKDTTGGIIIGRIWIRASESDCADIHASLVCHSIIPLAFQLDLFNPIAKDSQDRIRFSRSIRLDNFRWDLASNQATELSPPGTAFDVSRCPIATVLGSLDVSWTKSIDTPAACVDRSTVELNSFLARYLGDLLRRLDIYSPRDLMLTRVSRRPTLAARRAHFDIQLAQVPAEMHKFELTNFDPNLVQATAMIDRRSKSETLFDCLSFAAQNLATEIVLHSEQTGECNLYKAPSKLPSTGWSHQLVGIDPSLFDTYRRSLASRSSDQPKVEKLLKDFLQRDLRHLNKVLNDQSETPNDLEACAGPKTLAHDIRIGPIRAHRDFLLDMKSGSSPYEKPPQLSGFKFEPSGQPFNADLVAGRIQLESATLRRCRSKCDQKMRCASFAYCHYPDERQSSCQLADVLLNQLADVSSLPVVRDKNCEIYSKNYLDYYEADEEAHDELVPDLKDLVEVKTSSGDMSIQECARSCLSHKQLTCLWFSYCPQEQTRCFNWPFQEELEAPQPSGVESKKVELNEIKPDTLSECLVYKRKSTSLFEPIAHFLANQSGWDSSTLFLGDLTHLNLDQCADRCMEFRDCLSFDMCLVTPEEEIGDSPSTNSFHVCRLLSRSVFGGQMSLRKLHGRDKTDPFKSATCDHYERTVSKAGISADQLNLLVNKLAIDAARQAETSYATKLVVAAALGLSIGIVANYVFAFWSRDPQLFPQINVRA